MWGGNSDHEGENSPHSRHSRNTPIESEPDRGEEELRHSSSLDQHMKRRRSKSKPRPKINDVISPLESVSIVGIEQMLPSPPAQLLQGAELCQMEEEPAHD